MNSETWKWEVFWSEFRMAAYANPSLLPLSFFHDFEVQVPAELTHCVAKSFSGPSAQPDRASLEQAF